MLGTGKRMKHCPPAVNNGWAHAPSHRKNDNISPFRGPRIISINGLLQLQLLPKPGYNARITRLQVRGKNRLILDISGRC